MISTTAACMPSGAACCGWPTPAATSATTKRLQPSAKKNKWWLDDFALFMAVKGRFEGKPWIEWAEDIRLRWQPAMDYYRRELYFEVEYHKYLQFKFDQQWRRLKAYANSKGIRIIGDIPIYVALDSADAWANPGLFQLDKDNIPTAVAGVPRTLFFAHRPALGQSALPLGSPPRNRLSVVDHPPVVLLRALRCGAHRPLPRLR